MQRPDDPMVQAAPEPQPPVAPQQHPQQQMPAGEAPPSGTFANVRNVAARSFDPRRKSPVLASILSIMPGLGQVYVGYYKLGFIHLFVFASTIAILASEPAEELMPLFGIFLPFFVLYNIVDAGRRAAFYNQALEGMPGHPELPSDMTLPTGGSLVGGVALIVVGLVFLSNTKFGIPWYWLEEWWPLAPIAFGVYLFARGLQERAEKDRKND